MERTIATACRRRFIRWRLRIEHQRRMEFDCKLRMQARVRAGKLYAIQWPDDFSWTIWREGNRGYLVPVVHTKFPLLSSALLFIRSTKTVVAGENIKAGQLVFMDADGKVRNTVDTKGE